MYMIYDRIRQCICARRADVEVHIKESPTRADLGALQEVQEGKPMYMITRPHPSMHLCTVRAVRRSPISRSRSA